jgi:AraC family transcriptional regulator
MEIQEKIVKEMKVAYANYNGTYTKIPEYIQEVGHWVIKHHLEMGGAVYGTYYNSPEEVSEEELEYEIGFSIIGEAEGEDKFMIKKVPEHTVLAAIHKGAYTEVGPVIHELAGYAVKQGYDIIGPITEFYLNDPSIVPENELLTEVQFPVSKK